MPRTRHLPEIFPPTPLLSKFSAVGPVVVAGGLHLECLVEAVPYLDADGEIHGGQPILRTVQEFGEVSFRHDYEQEASRKTRLFEHVSHLHRKTFRRRTSFPLSRSHLQWRLNATRAYFVSYDVWGIRALRFD